MWSKINQIYCTRYIGQVTHKFHHSISIVQFHYPCIHTSVKIYIARNGNSI